MRGKQYKAAAFPRSPSEASIQAVIVTVCVEPRATERILDAIARLPWLTDISQLDNYSSALRRPAFGPQMKAADAGIAFIDFTQDITQAIECTQYLVHTFGSKLVVIAIGDDQNSDLILEAMRAGCSEYLSDSLTPEALNRTIQRFRHRWTSAALRSTQEGSVLALFGAKGGVGNTTLAVHLAFYLTEQHQKRVLLIDGQTELGHACIYLGLDGTRFTFHEVVRNVDRLDSDLLQGYVAKHESGLAVLSSPSLPDQQVYVEPLAVAKTLDFLRSEYDYVIVDCDHSFNECTRLIMDAASRVYLVTTPDVCAVRDLSLYADRLLRDIDASERLNIVVNRFDANSQLDLARIEKSLRLPINIRIPNSYAELVKSGNRGNPLSPDSNLEVTRELRRWAASLVQVPRPVSAESPRQAGRLRSLWDRRSGQATGKGVMA